MTDGLRRRGVPLWLSLSVVAAIGFAVLVIGAIWYQVEDNRSENRSQCQQLVSVRADSRAMWLALFDAFPESAEESGLPALLDETQPPLVCVGNSPLPVPLASID